MRFSTESFKGIESINQTFYTRIFLLFLKKKEKNLKMEKIAEGEKMSVWEKVEEMISKLTF